MIKIKLSDELMSKIYDNHIKTIELINCILTINPDTTTNKPIYILLIGNTIILMGVENTKRKSLLELKKLVLKEIDHYQDFIKTMEGDQNLQIKEMVIENKARLDTLDAVLHYINNGSGIYFNA